MNYSPVYVIAGWREYPFGHIFRAKVSFGCGQCGKPHIKTKDWFIIARYVYCECKRCGAVNDLQLAQLLVS